MFTHIVLFITVFLAWYWVIHYGNADPDGPGGLGPDFAVSPGWKYVYHPALMVTGFVLFMGEAIIAYRILPYDHATQKVIHLTLHTIALIFSSVGIWGMIMSVRQRKDKRI